MDEFRLFGYRELDNVTAPVAVRTAPGKHADTLQPVVVVFFRHGEEADAETGFALTPEAAEDLAEHMRLTAKRARERHWE
jgi:hypothetical protein